MIRVRFQPKLYRRPWFWGVLLSVICGAYLIAPTVSHAATTVTEASNAVGNTIFLVLSYVVMGMTKFFATMTGIFISLLIVVARYNTFLHAPVVESGWPIVRDLMNMLFIIALLIIAAGTVLRLQNYRYNRLLGRLIIMALLVNFSKFIAVFLLQFAQVVMLTFVNAFKDVAFGNFSHMFGLDAVLNFTREKTLTNITADNGNLSVFMTLVGGLAMMMVAFVVILAITVILFIRIIALWLLIVISPAAYALRILPNTENLASQWWSRFSKYVVVGPVLAFYLWISLALVSQINTCPDAGNVNVDCQSNPITATKDNGVTTAFTQAENDTKALRSDLLTEALGLNRLMTFVVGIIFLMLGLNYAQSFGGTAGAWAKKVAEKGFGVASTVTGLNAIRDRTIAPVQGYLKQRAQRRQDAIQRNTAGFAKTADWVENQTVGRVQRGGAALTGSVVAGARAVPKQAIRLGAAAAAVGKKMLDEREKANKEREMENKAQAEVATAQGRGQPITIEQARDKVRADEAKRQAAHEEAIALNQKFDELKKSRQPYSDFNVAQDAAIAENQRLEKEKIDQVNALHGEALDINRERDRQKQLDQTRIQDQERAHQEAIMTQRNEAAKQALAKDPIAKTVEQLGENAAKTSSGLTMLAEALINFGKNIAQAGAIGATGGWTSGTRNVQEIDVRRKAQNMREIEEAMARLQPGKYSPEQRRAMSASLLGADRAAMGKYRYDSWETEKLSKKEKDWTAEDRAREAEKEEVYMDYARFVSENAKTPEEFQAALGDMSNEMRNNIITGLSESYISDGQRHMLANIGGIREAYTKDGITDKDSALDHLVRNGDKMVELFKKSGFSAATLKKDEFGKEFLAKLHTLRKMDDLAVVEATKDKGFAKVYNDTMVELAHDIHNGKFGELGRLNSLAQQKAHPDEYAEQQTILERAAIGTRGGKIKRLNDKGETIKEADGKTDKEFNSLTEIFQNTNNEDEQKIIEKFIRTKGRHLEKLDYIALKTLDKTLAEIVATNFSTSAMKAIFEKAPASVEQMLKDLFTYASEGGVIYKGKLEVEDRKRFAEKLRTAARDEVLAGLADTIDKDDIK